MSVSYVSYDLQNGYIQHWLVAGPQRFAMGEPATSGDEDLTSQVAELFYEENSGITERPVEPGPLSGSEFTVGDTTGRWAKFVCADDHLVDRTATYPLRCYLRAWAYCQVISEHAGTVAVTLTSYGPTDVWVNGAHAYRQTGFGPHDGTFPADLAAGANEILVRFEQVGRQACRHSVAVRLGRADAPSVPAEGVSVQLPTAIVDVVHRNRLERALETAYLDRDVFVSDEQITVHWTDEMVQPEEVTLRLQTPSGRIYAESSPTVSAGGDSVLRSAYDVPQGSLQILMRRVLSLWGTGRQRYAEQPYGTYDERRVEALRYAAGCDGEFFGEVAKMALGTWDTVERPVVLQAIERIDRREAGSEIELLGLLGMLTRWGDHPAFPDEIQAPTEACILNFRYGLEPDLGDVGDVTESHEILVYACELLAGQRYLERVFPGAGETGQVHFDRAGKRILAWLRDRAAGGFADWGSGAAVATELIALSYLMDLAEQEAIWEMATVIVDKLLFTIALNSYKGVLGMTQGRADVTSIKGGLLAPTAGITRVLWGMGIFNQHLAGIVSLACMDDYELPKLMQEIAVASLDEMWSCEQHLRGADDAVNKVTYRTPDYILGSAQDYHPGDPGRREHIWQATFGPEAAVFANHPACAGTTAAHVPGFWLGNGVLPRVAQWKDALITLYDLPESDWMGYTHAYFPVRAFDAYAVRGGEDGQVWAFAKKGDGYLALTASRGFDLVTSGPDAYRELRSYGSQNVWLCQMGRAALDGSFEAFQEFVLAMPIAIDALSVRWTTLRGETLAFDWAGPLWRDGQEQPLSGFKHYDSPHCVSDLHPAQMEIVSNDVLMRIKFTEVVDLS